VATFHDQVELVVLPPLCPLGVSSSDFRSAALLIDRARVTSTRWLDEGNHRLPHPERFLALRRHVLPRLAEPPMLHEPAVAGLPVVSEQPPAVTIDYT